jgi:hypothetical protein
MIRFQFGLKTVFVVMTACCLLLAWWAPAPDDVRFAELYFRQWQPSVAALRITTAKEYYRLLGYEPDPKIFRGFDRPDFSRSDVIAVPLNGLAGGPSAEDRVEGLQKPVHVDFRNAPRWEVADTLKDQTGVEIQYDRHQFWAEGMDEDIRITFHADKMPLREALHAMLKPQNLTTLILPDKVVVITTPGGTRNVWGGPRLLSSNDWFDLSRPQLRHRLRMHGKLVVITSFAGELETDSRAVGYAVPKGAKVLFLTDRMATVMDAGYTLAVVSLAVLLIVFFERRKGHRPGAEGPHGGGGKGQ